MTQLLVGAGAAVAVQVEPKPESQANSHHNSNVEGHDKQHDVVGIKAVQRMQQRALSTVQRVLGGRSARAPGQEERHGRVVIR